MHWEISKQVFNLQVNLQDHKKLNESNAVNIKRKNHILLWRENTECVKNVGSGKRERLCEQMGGKHMREW